MTQRACVTFRTSPRSTTSRHRRKPYRRLCKRREQAAAHRRAMARQFRSGGSARELHGHVGGKGGICRSPTRWRGHLLSRGVGCGPARPAGAAKPSGLFGKLPAVVGEPLGILEPTTSDIAARCLLLLLGCLLRQGTVSARGHRATLNQNRLLLRTRLA